MNIATITQKINTLKATYSNIQKQNPDSEIIFEFSDELGNIVSEELRNIPSGEIILKEFEDSKKLILKISKDGFEKNQKILFDETVSAKVEFVKNETQFTKENENSLGAVIKAFTDGNREFLNTIQSQFTLVTNNLQAEKRETISEFKENQKEIFSYLKDITKSNIDKSEKDKDKQAEYFEKSQKKLEENFDDRMKFYDIQRTIQNEHTKKMNDLEIEKKIETHKLEIARINLNANKTTPSEWASIIKETVPSMVDSFKEVIQVYNSVKDIEIKKVN